MLLAIMYHRVGKGKHANKLETLAAHLKHLKQRYPIVLPGDPLSRRKVSVCLTFDDASFDFYHYVFPLLKELQIRALLGVPVKYILDKTDIAAEERLSVPYTLAMQDGFYEKKAPFCTWQELKEMVVSGLVQAASHSYMHCNLTFDFVDLDREVVKSKEILEKKLQQSVSSFIYPFGKTNVSVHEYVRGHYPYAFRIGSSLNWSWNECKGPVQRIIGDNMPSPYAPTSKVNMTKYLLKRIFC